jgi:aspartyl protease family protein
MHRTQAFALAMLRVCAAAALVCAQAAGAQQQAAAPALSFSGRMGDKALIVIGGQPRTLAVGSSAGGVRLLALSADSARVETAGRVLDLPLGGTPQAVGAVGTPSGSGTIVLTAGVGGHFNTVGMINGRPVQFMVDTGASSIAIGKSEADRLGIDVSKLAPTGMASTANGPVPIWRVVLTSVRVGEVSVSQVEAVVVPAEMPYVLLGNSFLSRFQMQRENDVMRLELRR